ncbi:MAG: hypothetical protein VX454_07690 [Pseudomonadota bacterium]|nr:hypothetical protein [Pseudomonadota bacterium]
MGLRLPFPERLEEPDSFVQQILDQSLAKALTRQAPFRQAATETAIVLVVRSMYPWLGPKRCHAILVDRTSSEAVTVHLRSLIVQEGYDRLIRFWEEETELDIVELAEGLVEVNDIAPEIARCFLEFRLTDAYSIAAKFDDPPIALMDEVHRGMLMIILLHELRRSAMLLADQIHRPTGWIRLDGSDSIRSGSTLTTGALVKEVQADHNLAELVLNLYNFSNETCATKNRKTPSKKYLQNAEKTFRETGVFCRAKNEVAELTSNYGPRLNANLEICMLELEDLVQRQKLGLSIFSSKYHSNTVYGNIRRSPPATLLYVMTSEVYSWLATPKANTIDWKSVALEETKYRSGHRTKSPGSLGRPRIQAGRSAIDTLHALYRVIFIRDNEAVPKQLRIVKCKDGKQRCARSVRQIEKLTGKEFNFDEVFNLFQSSMDAGQLVDSQAKRDAKRIMTGRVNFGSDVMKAASFATDTLNAYL